MMESYEAIVVGAGMAGLTAARVLAQSGMRVLIVEARDRVGGRILTRQVHDEAIELGAQFVHGKPASLWSLIEESGVATYELQGKEFCWRNHSLSECGPEPDQT
ncbi:MAG TPA: FAD-dependent oxidoreductase, partial [Acidobacteriaceae bacterium]|nr:FAD-dependent oxidoreductase [Acidobacteriaceae bacterium]